MPLAGHAELTAGTAVVIAYDLGLRKISVLRPACIMPRSGVVLDILQIGAAGIFVLGLIYRL